MSKRGFVDKNLFGLKDKLQNHSVDQNTEEPTSVPVPESQTDLDAHSIEEKTEKPISPFGYEKEEPQTIDKEYFEALVERKKEFAHKQTDILKRVEKNLEKLSTDIERYEKQLVESKKIKDKLTTVLNNIGTIKEKEWDKKDFSAALAKAMKTIENSRLELFALQQKTDCLLEDNIPGLEKNQRSFIPELTSLSPRQVFKLGASFFFPLIIGLILTGILISLGMFVAMGVI